MKRTIPYLNGQGATAPIRELILLMTASLLMGLSCRKEDIRVLTEEMLRPERFHYQFSRIDQAEGSEGPIPEFYFADLNNDGFSEIIEVNNTEMNEPAQDGYLQVRDDLSSLVDRLDFIGLLGFKEDLIFSVTTPLPYLPRGIFVYDLANKQKLWSHEGGYAVTYIVTTDVIGGGIDRDKLPQHRSFGTYCVPAILIRSP